MSWRNWPWQIFKFFTDLLFFLFLHQIQEAGQISGRRVYSSERHFESTRRKAGPRGSQGGSRQLSGGGQGLQYFMRSLGQGFQLFLSSLSTCSQGGSRELSGGWQGITQCVYRFKKAESASPPQMCALLCTIQHPYTLSLFCVYNISNCGFTLYKWATLRTGMTNTTSFIYLLVRFYKIGIAFSPWRSRFSLY